jgi:hypothetical protein
MPTPPPTPAPANLSNGTNSSVRRLTEEADEAALWADLASLLPAKDWAALLAELNAASAERNASAPRNASARRLHGHGPDRFVFPKMRAWPRRESELRLRVWQDLEPLQGTCLTGFLQCDMNRCIPMESICDGVLDCDDGMDENWCAGTPDSPFFCRLGRQCKNRRGRACVVPNTGGCAEDDTILPKQHSVCGAEARATLKQSAYCAPESLDACLCLQTLGEALHPKLHCVPPGGTMDPPQTLLSHMQRRCLETARAESAPACETNAEAALKEIAHCRTQRWCPCADYLASGVRIPAIEPGYSLDSPEQAVRCDFGMMPPNSDQPGVVTSATRVTLLGYVRGLCESQEGWAAYRKSHEDAALERPPERRDVVEFQLGLFVKAPAMKNLTAAFMQPFEELPTLPPDTDFSELPPPDPIQERIEAMREWIPKVLGDTIEEIIMRNMSRMVTFEPEWIDVSILAVQPPGKGISLAQGARALGYRGTLDYAGPTGAIFEALDRGERVQDYVERRQEYMPFSNTRIRSATLLYERVRSHQRLHYVLQGLGAVKQWATTTIRPIIDQLSPTREPQPGVGCPEGMDLIQSGGFCWSPEWQEMHVNVAVHVPDSKDGAKKLLDQSLFVMKSLYRDGLGYPSAAISGELWRNLNRTAPHFIGAGWHITDFSEPIMVERQFGLPPCNADANEVDCGDGICLMAVQRCDGVEDCATGVDEFDCNSNSSGNDTLQGFCEQPALQPRDGEPERTVECATSTGRPPCIPPAWICDGSNDCLFGEDEENCVTSDNDLWKVGYPDLSFKPRVETPWVGLELERAVDVQCAKVIVPLTKQTQKFKVFSCAERDVHLVGFPRLLREPWLQCEPAMLELEFPEPEDPDQAWPFELALPIDLPATEARGAVLPMSTFCGFDVVDRINYATAFRVYSDSGPLDRIVRCYCHQRIGLGLDVSGIAICKESLQEQNNRAGDAIVLMLVLVAFHGILQMVVEQIVDLFDPLSVSERNLLVFDLLAPLQIMMSSLMLCISCGKWYGLTVPPIPPGWHADVTQDWFTHMGASATFVILAFAFVPHFPLMLWVVFLQSYRKEIAGQLSYTSQEYLAWHTNAVFSVPQRAATMAETLVLVSAFSPGLPSLWYLGALRCFMVFWCDRVILLRGSTRVAHSDGSVPTRVARWVGFSVIIHGLSAAWTFSYQPLFPSPDTTVPVMPLEEDGFARYRQYLQERIYLALTSPASFPAVVLLVLATFVMATQFTVKLGMMYPTFCGRFVRMLPFCGRMLEEAEDDMVIGGGADATAETYEDAIEGMIESGLTATYDVRHHRKYGGTPMHEVEVEDLPSTKESEHTPTPPESVDSWPPFEYDAIGSTTRKPVMAPPQPNLVMVVQRILQPPSLERVAEDLALVIAKRQKKDKDMPKTKDAIIDALLPALAKQGYHNPKAFLESEHLTAISGVTRFAPLFQANEILERRFRPTLRELAEAVQDPQKGRLPSETWSDWSRPLSMEQIESLKGAGTKGALFVKERLTKAQIAQLKELPFFKKHSDILVGRVRPRYDHAADAHLDAAWEDAPHEGEAVRLVVSSPTHARMNLGPDLGIRNMDMELVPALPPVLDHKVSQLPHGSVQAFVRGKHTVEMRGPNTRFRIYVHDERTVQEPAPVSSHAKPQPDTPTRSGRAQAHSSSGRQKSRKMRSAPPEELRDSSVNSKPSDGLA